MNIYYKNDNLEIYNDDNLNVLKGLKDNSVNLIYCDILYNTGKVFDDYNDDLGTPLEAMEWYRPRIEQMRRVLAENGSIFIHCNWRIDSYIRVLMDEIFGIQCFRNRIYRKHSEERGFYENFDSQMDIILYYVKNPGDFIFNEILGDTLKVYPIVENGVIEGRSNELNYKKFSYNPIVDIRHWILPERIIKEMIDKDEIVIIDGIPCRKTYAIPMGNLWDEAEMLDTYKRNRKALAYDTPKPEAVLERIIKIASNDGDIIADFFCGGGTTAVVGLKMNRKVITCDISKKACDVTLNKIKLIK